MHAELLMHDEIQLIQEQMKMQETTKETNTAPIEWKVVLPEGANALPMKCSMYSSGDYWTPFQDLQMQGEDHPHTEGPLQALMGLRTVSAYIPGLEVTIGVILHPKYRDDPRWHRSVRNGEPIVMLGQPRMHKHFAAVTEYRCVEMRVGKWLANYYGNGVDFRSSSNRRYRRPQGYERRPSRPSRNGMTLTRTARIAA